MNRLFYFFPLALALSFSVNAQVQRLPVSPENGDIQPSKATKSDVQSVPPLVHTRSDDSFNFYFRDMEENEVRNPEIEAIKNSYPSKRNAIIPAERNDDTRDMDALTLNIGQQYDANPFDGSYPPDNNIAVSASGWVVTVVNSSVRFYNSAGILKASKSVENFVNDGALNDIIFDPRVIFDSGSNRFIFCVLHGSSPSTSKVLLMFSTSDDPMDDWNYYNIPINAAVTNRWADFPNIGVSNNEVYVTVNLFSSSGNYDKSLLYQIDKNNGFNNQTLTYQYWTDISDDSGVEPFNIVPVSYGQDGNYGPGIILVSTPNLGNASRIQVYDLTNDMSASNEALYGYHVNLPAYQIGSNAEQPDGEVLDVGDTRMKSAFFLNNTIHCVFSLAVNAQGYNGIIYNRIATNPLDLNYEIFEQTGVDLAYPSVASFSAVPWDPSVVIYYEHSSSSINPGCKALICDADHNFGTPIVIKNGTSHIDVENDPGSYERWGDYTGICRKAGSLHPTVWVFGIYGNNSNVYANNVCELTDPNVNVGINTPEIAKTELTVYPNPAEQFFMIKLESDEDVMASIGLYDATGKLVKQLPNKQLHQGDYEIGFGCTSLPAGVYFLRVTSSNKTIANEKIVVQ